MRPARGTSRFAQGCSDASRPVCSTRPTPNSRSFPPRATLSLDRPLRRPVADACRAADSYPTPRDWCAFSGSSPCSPRLDHGRRGRAARRTRAPTAPVPRVDSVRVDTLRRAAPDTARRVDAPAPPARTPTQAAPASFGPHADLGLDVHARIEAKGEQHKNERCDGSQQSQLVAHGCRDAVPARLQLPVLAPQQRHGRRPRHVNVDYDTQREFDASNAINVYYEGKRDATGSSGSRSATSRSRPRRRASSPAACRAATTASRRSAQLGRFRVQAIAAQQKGNVVKDRIFIVGDRTRQDAEREIEDYQIEPRRFFFTVDPALFGGAYPNIDILDRSAAGAARGGAARHAAADGACFLYRLLFGAQPQNPNGPRFRLQRRRRRRTRQTYELLREGVDYYIDPSQLWFALVRPLSQTNERLVVAYKVRIERARHGAASPRAARPTSSSSRSHDQFANLVWDPNVAAGDRRVPPRDPLGVSRRRRGARAPQTRRRASSPAQRRPGEAAPAARRHVPPDVRARAADEPGRLRRREPAVAAAHRSELHVAAGGTAARSTRLGSRRRAVRAADHPRLLPRLSVAAAVRAARTRGSSSPGIRQRARLHDAERVPVFAAASAVVYRLRSATRRKVSGDAGALMLGSVQVRRGSERVVIDGRAARARRRLSRRLRARPAQLRAPDTLFPRQRARDGALRGESALRRRRRRRSSGSRRSCRSATGSSTSRRSRSRSGRPSRARSSASSRRRRSSPA